MKQAKSIQVNIKIYDCKRDLLFLNYSKEFTGKSMQKESTELLERVSKMQMQRIANKLNLGTFKKSMILLRANSVYHEYTGMGTEFKPQYQKFARNNDWNIKVSVNSTY